MQPRRRPRNSEQLSENSATGAYTATHAHALLSALQKARQAGLAVPPPREKCAVQVAQVVKCAERKNRESVLQIQSKKSFATSANLIRTNPEKQTETHENPHKHRGRSHLRAHTLLYSTLREGQLEGARMVSATVDGRQQCSAVLQNRIQDSQGNEWAA